MLSRKIITLLIYIILLAVLFAIQPKLFFDNEGNMKCFGFDTNNSEADEANTILPLILFVPFIAILSYLVILIIEMIYT
uniref:Uncharacterized protein n=1 Tax=viral metagenome TaxID=1070528 RepID=A0A6C0IB77_9ZZZZ